MIQVMQGCHFEHLALPHPTAHHYDDRHAPAILLAAFQLLANETLFLLDSECGSRRKCVFDREDEQGASDEVAAGNEAEEQELDGSNSTEMLA